MSRLRLRAHRAAGAVRPRDGFTLIELMIAMTLLTIVGTAVVTVFNNQQRFVRSATDVGAIRSQVQTALAVLPSELREVSPADGDILAMSDSSIQVMATVTSSIVCNFLANTVTLAPEQMDPARPLRLTSVAMPPQVGDSLYIWDDGPSTASNNDSWRTTAGRAYGITNVETVAGGCLAPYTSAGNAAASAYRLTVDGATPLRGTLVRGAALRVTRHVRYGLYQSPVDAQWYLGYREPLMPAYQFVAGPFRPYRSGEADPSGLRFRYWNVAGAEIPSTGLNITNAAVTSTVARVEITVRAASLAPLSLGGSAAGKTFYDSLRVGVSFRNRN